MAKYRKKPVVIEAFRFYIDNMPDWFMDAVTDKTVILINCGKEHQSKPIPPHCVIHMLEGDHVAFTEEYIIRGVKGEIYPCKPDIFEMTYEEVEVKTTGVTSDGWGINEFVKKQNKQ